MASFHQIISDRSTDDTSSDYNCSWLLFQPRQIQNSQKKGGRALRARRSQGRLQCQNGGHGFFKLCLLSVRQRTKRRAAFSNFETLQFRTKLDLLNELA